MLIKLSRLVQRSAQPRMLRICFLNGLHTHFMTIVFLMALQARADDTVMGLLYAAPHLLGVFVIFVPILLNNRETTAIWSGFWWAGTVIAVGFFALPYLHPATAQVWGVLLVYYLFTGVRVLGAAAAPTVQKALTAPRDLPAVMARLVAQFNLGYLIISVITYVLLRQHWLGSDEQTFMFLIGFGVVVSGILSWQTGRLPQTGYLDPSSFRDLGKVIREVFATRHYREMVFLTFLQTALTVCVPYLLNYLQRLAHTSNDRIFFLTVLGMLGAIAISVLLRAIGVRIGARILLFGAHALLAILGLLWAFVEVLPFGDTFGLHMVLYTLVGIGMSGSGAVMLQLLSSILPEKNSVQFTVVFLLVSVVSAVLTIGAVRVMSGLGLAALPALHAYSPTFFLWSLLSVSICIFSLTMHGGETKTFVKQLALLSPNNLRTLYVAHRNENRGRSEASRWNVIEGLMLGASVASRGLLLETMHSPDVRRRYSALRTLTNAPNPEAYEAVLAEACEEDSPIRLEAITTLGFLNNRAANPILRKFLAEDDPSIRAVTVKSLLRLGEEFSDAELSQQYAALTTTSTRLRWEVLFGLTGTRNRPLLFQFVGKELVRQPTASWTIILCQFLAETYDRRESLTELFDEERSEAGAGLQYFLTEFKTRLPAGLAAEQLQELFDRDTSEGYADLSTRLKTESSSDAEWLTAFDRTSALGVLYVWGVSFIDQPKS